eukprot:1177729-Prorocentrum_minimum.AAC.4
MPEHDYGSETTNIIMIAFSDIVHEQTHAKLALSTTDTLTTPKRVTHLIRPGRNATLNRRLIFIQPARRQAGRAQFGRSLGGIQQDTVTHSNSA